MNEQFEQILTKSSRKRRIAAFLIDHFIITFLMVSIVFVAVGSNFMDDNNFSKMTTIMFLVMIPVFIIYFAKDSIKGISGGRWIMGIMVREEMNFQIIPSFWKLFVRNLFIIIWPVEFIILASSDEKKRLGDKFTKTVVLNNPNKSKKLSRVIALVGIGVVFFVFVFLFAGNAMKNSDAYKVAIHNIEINQDIINETGGITGYGMMPTGNISISNGHGQAQFQIKVLGKTKNVDVNIYLEKEPNEQWQIRELNK